MKNKAIEESNSEWLFFIDSNEAIISGIDKLFVIENEKAFSEKLSSGSRSIKNLLLLINIFFSLIII